MKTLAAFAVIMAVPLLLSVIFNSTGIGTDKQEDDD